MDRHQSAEHRLGCGADEACFADHPLEGGWARKAADALDQIAIALLVTRYRLADAWDDVRRPCVVDRRESRPVARRKFHAEEASAAFDNAKRLAQGGRDIGDVPDPEHNRVSVETGAFEGQ